MTSQSTTEQLASHTHSLVTRTPILNDGESEAKREEIRRYFHDTFSLYESLFECLASEEAFYARANPLRHPLIFYYGHTSVFFINKLNVANLIDQRIDPSMESTLAIGVDEMSWDDLNERSYNWPTPEAVKAHRDQTREVVDQFIRDCDCTVPIDWDHPLWIVLMGIEHERIHLETTAVLIRELPLELVEEHSQWSKICSQSKTPPQNALLPVSGGQVELGKAKSDLLYGWDNEYGYAAEEVDPFLASKFLVSNAEFKTFVDDGGYSSREFWTEEGWQWATYRQAKQPVYWVQAGSDYSLRTMLEVIDMPWDWPAEVNYLEAKAFCNWMSQKQGRSIRLPSEAEWYRLRESVDTDQPDWETAPGNVNLEGEMSPCPVDRHEFPGGFFDVVGNVWQWTETAIEGFDGFETHPVYDDFSAPTFDGKHNIFKGGSWISTGNLAINASRYAFRRHFFQYSGFRFVEAAPLVEKEVNVYETDEMVSRYIDFHYGPSHLNVENFPVRCVGEIKELLGDGPRQRALDIGCSAARASFELAQLFDRVDALDFSARLIETPTNLQKHGKQRYVLQDEGELGSHREVRLSEFPGYEEVKDRIAFMQGDACNLLDKFSDYDLVFAGNLLDRLYDPVRFLQLIKDRIRVGGMLVLASPYTWLEEYTPRDRWIGGFKADTGENFTSLDGIAAELLPEFEMVGEPKDIPFVIRETGRKYQYSLSQFSAWRKR